MKSSLKETIIIYIIRYTLFVFMIILAISLSLYISSHYKSDLQREQMRIQTDYLATHKERIKVNVTTINKFINSTLDNAQEALKKDLQHKIRAIHRLALNIYEKNKDTLSKEEIITHIKNAIETMRFDEGRGYFSMHTIEGMNILQPINRDFEGTSVLNRKDSKGNYPVQKAIKIANTKGEGIFSWYYFKPNDRSKEFKKVGIVKKFEPYNLMLTTAIYEEDYLDSIKKNLLEHFSLIEYQDRGDVVVLDLDAQFILKKSLSSLKENEKALFLKNMKNFINSSQKSTYIQYAYDSDRDKFTKISYFQKADAFGWIVGTGFNLDTLHVKIQTEQQKLQEEYSKHLYFIFVCALIITVLLLIISLWFSKFLEKMFFAYKKELLKQEANKFESMLEELSNILNHLPIMFIYKDTHNNILRVNKAFAKAHNFTVEELKNVAAKDVFPLTYEKYYLDDLKIIKTKKPILNVIQSYPLNNRIITVETSKIPIFNKQGEVSNIVVCNIDITQRIKEEIEKINNYEQTIISLVDLIEQRDFYTGGHSHRVAQYAVDIAKELNFSSQDIAMLKQIGLLHDIGKIAIPDSILLKPGRLTAQEFDIIKSHAQIGYNVISKIPMFKEFANIILWHHERYDGSGYPDGLKKGNIPTLASVLSIADSFDAMTSTRIYNKTKSVKEALDELKKGSGTLYEPKILNTALKVLKNIDLKATQQGSQLPKTLIEKERFAYFFKDVLTNISNENYFDLLLKQDLHQYKCLNLILLHNFSSYNEKFGWEKGNELLVYITKYLQKNYSLNEIFRFQGTNFILLNNKHLDINIDEMNKELSIYDIKCELRHFDIDEFNSLEVLRECLRK